MDPTQQPTHPPSDPSPMAQPPPPQTQTPPSSLQPPKPPSPLPPTPPLSAPPIAPSTNPNPSKTLTPLLQPESHPQPHHHQQQQQQAQQLELDHKQELHDQQFSGFQGTQNRPVLARHWQQTSHMSPFQPHLLPGIPGPSTSAATSSPSPIPSSLVSATPRGGTAIGVPAMRPGMSPQPNAFSTSFGYGMVPRNPANASELPSSSAPSMVRPALHGVQMIGSQMQAGALTGNHQHRPQLSYRPQSSSVNQPSPSQNFQGQCIMRPSSMGSVTSTSQGPSSQNQTWLTHGRPPITIPPSRPPLNPQSLQQKSQMTPQLHHVMPPPALQQQQIPSSQQQHQPSKSLNQQREHPGQQLSVPRVHVPPSSSSQQTRVQGSANLKSSLTAVPQSSTLQPVTIDTVPAAEIDESNKRIIGKRSIQELVNQIDPSEKLDPEVEDILIDIAEEFVESITTFGCSLAKHRQSSTLEAKDILLHLERNWNMTLPGFCGDEIKTFKKPVTNDLHRERLTIVRKSVAGAEMGKY